MKRTTDVKLDDRTDIVVFSIALESGRFNTQLKLPLFHNQDHLEALGKWFEFVQTGLKIGATHMDASWPVTLKEEKECPDHTTSPSTP